MTRRLRLSLHTHLCGLSLALDNSLLQELGFFPAWLHGLADTCGSFPPSLLKDFNITGWGSAEKAETRTCFFLAGLGSLDGIHLACVIGREHGVSVVGVGNRGAVYGVGWVGAGRVAFPCWSRSGGGIRGVSFLSTFPLFFNPVRSLGQDTAQYTHTQRLGLQKERDSAVGGMDWDARGCGISFRTGLVWSGLVWFFFFIWNGNTHLIHITSPHDGTSTLHCTAPTPLDGGRTGGQGYRLASSGRPAASYLLQPYS